MTGDEIKTGQRDWTEVNIQKLLVAVRTSIPEQERMYIYSKGLRSLDWQRIAFHPFSPKSCKMKWEEIFQKTRKVRTLTEIIVEAEDAIFNPGQNKTGHNVEKHQSLSGEYNRSTPECRGGVNNALKMEMVCRPSPLEQFMSMAGVSKNEAMKICARHWRDLTETQRQEYRTRCEELKRQDWVKLNDDPMILIEEEQQWSPEQQRIKRRKVNRKEAKFAQKFPNEPKMPFLTCYSVFFHDQMELLKDKFPESGECCVWISNRWQALPEEEMERYKDKVNENIEKYSAELQRWFETLRPEEQKNYLTCKPYKCKYLDAQKIKEYHGEEFLYIISDSEDEDLEDSTDEENLSPEEDEEAEEEEDESMFEMYRW